MVRNVCVLYHFRLISTSVTELKKVKSHLIPSSWNSVPSQYETANETCFTYFFEFVVIQISYLKIKICNNHSMANIKLFFYKCSRWCCSCQTCSVVECSRVSGVSGIIEISGRGNSGQVLLLSSSSFAYSFARFPQTWILLHLKCWLTEMRWLYATRERYFLHINCKAANDLTSFPCC